MRHRSRLLALLLTVGAHLGGAIPAHAAVNTFSNPTAITIPAGAPGTTFGPAAPYPSPITVSGLTGVVTHVTVTLFGLSHGRPVDVRALLVPAPPTSQGVMLIQRAGGVVAANNATLVLDDCAPRALPPGGAFAQRLVSGRLRPSSYDIGFGNFPAPAPAGPYESALAAFNGLSGAKLNGTWNLFVHDVGGGGFTGSLAGGWSLTIFTSPALPGNLTPPSPVQSPSLNPVPCSAPDFDGDGRADISVYRQSTGEWFILRSGDGGLTQVAFGAPAASGLGDMPVPADYDGDGISDLAIFRPATAEWFILRSSDGAVTQIAFGAPAAFGLGDTPAPGDYDGDGQADLALFRSATGTWFILRTSDGGLTQQDWGAPALGDIPARP